MHLSTLVTPLLAAVLSLAPAACEVTVSPPPPTGTMTVHWTVADSTSPLACASRGASRLEVVVYDVAGNVVARVTPGCAAFGVTLELPDGTYTAEVTMIDAAGNARSTTLPLHAVEVVTGTDIALDVDFPRTSFF